MSDSLAIDAAFRFDRNAEIGYGHATRSMAVADTLEDVGWRIQYLVNPSSIVLPKMRGKTIVEESNALSARAESAFPGGCDVLFADSYDLDAPGLRAFRPWARQIVAFEDRPTRELDCDFLIDPTPEREPARYKGLVPENSTFLLGPSLAALRAPFLEMRAAAIKRRESNSLARILVAVGGTDTTNATRMFLQAIEATGIRFEVDVVLGAMAPHLKAIGELASRNGYNLHVEADAETVAKLTASADLALGAASSGAWERCCLGLPSIVVTTASNQSDIEAALKRQGCAVALGEQSQTSQSDIVDAILKIRSDRQALKAMSDRAFELCDGRGAWRILCALAGAERTRDGLNLSLRPADERDCGRVYDWNCEPQARVFFRNTEVPTRAAHDLWFAATIANNSRLLLIAEIDGTPVGSLRFDRQTDRLAPPEISIMIAHRHRSKGYGAAVLRLAKRVCRTRPLNAEIHAANAASQKAFAAAGFSRSSASDGLWTLPK
jgi:UDP-2,4-diacetamido-2,4,6-trideoxy-beta-L-altropyranose hydrolase